MTSRIFDAVVESHAASIASHYFPLKTKDWMTSIREPCPQKTLATKMLRLIGAEAPNISISKIR